MVKDLRILPQHDKGSELVLDVISLHPDGELFEIIEHLERTRGRDVPSNGITSFDNRNITETPYWNRLKGVKAGELKNELASYNTDDWKNRAAIAFINELPDDLEVWLFWY